MIRTLLFSPPAISTFNGRAGTDAMKKKKALSFDEFLEMLFRQSVSNASPRWSMAGARPNHERLELNDKKCDSSRKNIPPLSIQLTHFVRFSVASFILCLVVTSHALTPADVVDSNVALNRSISLYLDYYLGSNHTTRT